MVCIAGRVTADGFREGREALTLEYIEGRLKEYGVRNVRIEGNRVFFSGVRHRMLQLTPYSVVGGVSSGDILLHSSGSKIIARYTLKLNPYPFVMALAFLACLLVIYLVHEVTFSTSGALFFISLAGLFGLYPYWSLRGRLEGFLKRALAISTYRNILV